VATIADRWCVKPPIGVTVVAVRLGVPGIENLACDGVIEVVRIPVPVAGVARAVELREGYRGVAGSAAQLAVAVAQRPTRPHMLERCRSGLPEFPVATITLTAWLAYVGHVATLARLMMLLEGHDALLVTSPNLMAPVTIVLLVTLNASKPESINVLLVAENHV
jgi:hypothetical protein